MARPVIDIVSMIFHKVDKRQFDKTTVTTIAKHNLAIGSIHTDFMEQLHDIYTLRSNIRFGEFIPEEKFPQQLLKYRKSPDLPAFSKAAMNILEETITKVSAATGGYIVFAHVFADASDEYLYCAMLNDRHGFSISDSLDLEQSVHLAMNTLSVAGRVDLKRWEDGKDNHLSFKSPRDPSSYFRKFIGCEQIETTKSVTSELQACLRDYLYAKFKEEEPDVDHTDKIGKKIKEVIAYGLGKLDQGEPLQLTTVAQHVEPDDPDAFQIFATNRHLDSELHVHKADFSKLDYVSFQSADLRIGFPMAQVNHRILFDRQNQELLIKDVPLRLARQLGAGRTEENPVESESPGEAEGNDEIS